MKILLVYANCISEGYLPVGLASIAGAIRDSKHTVDLFDTSFYKTPRLTDREVRENYNEFKKVENETLIAGEKNEEEMYKDWLNKIKEFNPDIIGVGVTSTEFPMARILLKKAKENFPNIPILVGGTHPTVAPDKVIHEDCVDIVCLGEGESTIVELLDKMESRQDFSNIKNLWIKRNGEIIKNELRNLNEDLDSLPMPYWNLFDKRHFIRPFEGKITKYGFFEFGRGCPYSCTYCINRYMKKIHAGKGQYHREKSSDRMISEILECKKQIDIEHLFFVDDHFLAIEIDKLNKFAERYEKEIGMNCMVMARPETITPERIEILKRINCKLVMMGLESGSKEIREKICKRFMNEEVLFNACKLLKENGIMSSLYNIIGFPTETREQIFETINLNKKLNPDRVTVKILCPFEGTEIRDICIEKGYMGDEADITKMYYSDSCLNMPQLPPEEIKGLRKTFILYVYLPKFMWKIIKICEEENEFSNNLYNLLSELYLNKEFEKLETEVLEKKN